LTGRTNPPQPPKDERVLPAARWRTVGSIRRYILLVLMLGQTIVAGWYMKGIMPYQGWSFVDFDEVRTSRCCKPPRRCCRMRCKPAS
jgi:membrane glycosyltransferase